MLNNVADIEVLKNTLTFWNQISSEEQKLFIDNAIIEKYQKDKIVYNSAEDCKGLTIVKSGNLRAYILSESGKEITMYRLFENDTCIMTANCLLKNITFDMIIEAEKDSEIILIPFSIYGKLNNSNILIQDFTNQLVSSRFSDVMWVMEQVVFMSFDKRLAIFLLEQSAIEGSDIINTTHENIAKNLGSAREVVSRMLKYFQSSDIVYVSRGNIEIKNRKRLMELVG
jgi:CRP/FNR family transcriptional regulator